jgi:Icc-related predicted phosphoesterase
VITSMGTNDRVRIVAAGDTHLYHNDFAVPDGDIFVHVGDMCRGGEFHELRTNAEWITSLPHRHKVIVAGNHDWPFVHQETEARALFQEATYLQDAGVTIAGLRVYGSPWQPRFLDWAFNLPRSGKELVQVWSWIPEGLDVLITHGPPKGYGDLCCNGDHVGCEHLLRRVRVVKPRLHLFGHIRDAGGMWQEDRTTFLNVTTSECTRSATVIDFNPVTGEVSVQ